MDWTSLDALIDEFEALVKRGTWIFGPISFRFVQGPMALLGRQINDWRPVWEKVREIQAGFKAGVRYPTKLQRDAAWTRFNNLRNELREKSNAERIDVFEVSVAWRDWILRAVEDTRYSKVTDAIMSTLYFSPTTIEQIKRLGEELNEASKLLSKNKHQMLREHKDECFQRIQEVRQTHDAFWGEYKAARERRQQEYREKIDGVLERIEGNIAKNLEKKAKAEDALARVEAQIEKLNGLIEGAYTDEFRERFEGYLAEAEERRESISQSIQRMEEWVHQDRQRQNDIYSKKR